jgi:hypothetical protein
MHQSQNLCSLSRIVGGICEFKLWKLSAWSRLIDASYKVFAFMGFVDIFVPADAFGASNHRNFTEKLKISIKLSKQSLRFLVVY